MEVRIYENDATYDVHFDSNDWFFTCSFSAPSDPNWIELAEAPRLKATRAHTVKKEFAEHGDSSLMLSLFESYHFACVRFMWPWSVQNNRDVNVREIFDTINEMNYINRVRLSDEIDKK